MTCNIEQIQSELQLDRDTQKKYFDPGTKTLTNLKPGDVVRMETPRGWRPAEAEVVTSGPIQDLTLSNRAQRVTEEIVVWS